MADTIHAFTSQATGIAKQLRSDVYISDALKSQDVSAQTLHKSVAVWDTGAVKSCISESLAQNMGLVSVGKTRQFGVGGSCETERYIVDLILPNKVRCANVVVNSGKFTDFGILIGMDIISAGDFAISNFEGKTTFTFRLPSQETIDFCKQVSDMKKTATIKHVHGPGKRKKKKK